MLDFQNPPEDSPKAYGRLTVSVASSLKTRAIGIGFDLVGITLPAALKDMEFCREWLEKGYGGEMRYLANPKRADLARILPSVKSIVCVGLIYNTPYPYSTEISGGSQVDDSPHGWISRYAWGSDYHEVMRSKLEQLRGVLEELAPGVESRVFVDTGPVVERAFARFSGIGWVGKNTCLINEQKGSWLFLGVILTNLELTLDLPVPDRCGSCTRCLEACPTGALVEPYVMDASRCIAYFNIELRGSIPEQYRAAIGKNVFGCDICQDVCPWNRPLPGISSALQREATTDPAASSPRQVVTTRLEKFQPMTIEGGQSSPGADGGTNPGAPSHEEFSLFNPSLEALASLSEGDFRRWFAQSPIKRVKYRGWLRNLCVAMGNSGDRRFVPWLEAAARNPDAMVHDHAQWALGKLQAS